MLDYDTHSRLADATTELMRSCAVAAAQTMTASTCRGLMLWSDLLRAPDRRPAPPGDPHSRHQSLRSVLALYPGGLDAESQHVAPRLCDALLAAGLAASVCGLGATLCHLARDSRLVGLEPRLLAGVAKPTATGEPIRRAGSRYACRAQRSLALDLCQLPVRRRARRGAGHHDAQRRYGGGRADRDEPRPHADAHHAQHMAHRARHVTRAKLTGRKDRRAYFLAGRLLLRHRLGLAVGLALLAGLGVGRRRHPAAGRIGLARRLLGDGVALALGLRQSSSSPGRRPCWQTSRTPQRSPRRSSLSIVWSRYVPQ